MIAFLSSPQEARQVCPSNARAAFSGEASLIIQTPQGCEAQVWVDGVGNNDNAN